MEDERKIISIPRYCKCDDDQQHYPAYHRASDDGDSSGDTLADTLLFDSADVAVFQIAGSDLPFVGGLDDEGVVPDLADSTRNLLARLQLDDGDFVRPEL